MANLFGNKALFVNASFYKLAKIYFFIARNNIRCRNVADHAGDARKRRRCARICHQNIYKFLFRVGLPGAIVVVTAKTRTIHKNARIQLYFVGLESGIGYQLHVVLFIQFWRCSQKVHHDMNVRLEAEQTQRFKSVLDLFGGGVAIILFANLSIEALDAHLHFGTTKTPQREGVLGSDAFGTCFYNKAYHAVLRCFVYMVLLFKLFPGGSLPDGNLLPGTAFAIMLIECLVIGKFLV